MFPFPIIRPVRFWDTECYPNYWLIKFRDDRTGQIVGFPQWPGHPLDIAGVRAMLASSELIGFNTKNYDEPMTALALTGVSCERLKQANDAIIVGGVKPWQFYEMFNCVWAAEYDSVDIMEPTPGVRIGLKMYGGRAHSRQLQDLPIDPAKPLSDFDRVGISVYCDNDLETTRDVWLEIKPRRELRVAMTVQYNIDLRSKSDAQMAEAIIKTMLGFRPEKRIVHHGYQFHYQPPPFVQFKTQQLRDVFDTVCTHAFTCSDKEQYEAVSSDEGDDEAPADKIKTGVIIPPAIKKIRIAIGSSIYKFGMGGLHSQEKKIVHYAQAGVNTVSDHDVASYYPSLILLLGMFPQQLGPRFIEIYKSIYDERLSAKDNAKLAKKEAERLTALSAMDASAAASKAAKEYQTIADGLKIVLNGTFGKLFSKYSILFSPEQGVQVTITGQLCLLMLIEALEAVGIPVVSANTDGIVLKTRVGMEWLRDQIIKDWERTTGLEMEETQYKAMYCRDVNNYIAFKLDGEHKAKGVFGPDGIMAGASGKTPSRRICAEAVVEFLGKGIPIETTIYQATDIRKFLTVRQVKGGGVKRYKSPLIGTDFEPFEPPPDTVIELGKAVRWYYGKNETTGIYYKTNGNKVADSDGAVPMMLLKEGIPPDLNYDYYIGHARRLLNDLGVS